MAMARIPITRGRPGRSSAVLPRQGVVRLTELGVLRAGPDCRTTTRCCRLHLSIFAMRARGTHSVTESRFLSGVDVAVCLHLVSSARDDDATHVAPNSDLRKPGEAPRLARLPPPALLHVRAHSMMMGAPPRSATLRTGNGLGTLSAMPQPELGPSVALSSGKPMAGAALDARDNTESAGQ